MDKLDEYYKFLAEKQTAVHDSGFEIADEDLNPKLLGDVCTITQDLNGNLWCGT